MDETAFYRLINTVLFKAHEKLPTKLIPKDETLVTDHKYNVEIRNIVNRITGFTSKYSPQFEFQESPFDKEKIIPVIPFAQCSRMFAFRKSFEIETLLKAFSIKL